MYPPISTAIWRKHRFVTTPIAYLSTSVMDIFADPKRKDEWPWQCCTVGQYHCEPAYFAYNQNSKDPVRSNRSTAYFVLSYGPDGSLTGKPNNATNGVISSGNIIALSKANSVTDFPTPNPIIKVVLVERPTKSVE
jgi:hypothetical protein